MFFLSDEVILLSGDIFLLIDKQNLLFDEVFLFVVE